MLDALELALLLAEPADRALRRRVADELAAAGAPGAPRIAAAYGLAEVRQLSVECPAPADEPSGHHLFPDALLAEVEGEDPRGGELLLTPLVGHGTAVYRYRTGDRAPAPASWARCPACGRGLPRIGPIAARLDEELDLGGGARLDFAALRAALDGRRDLLEWQLLVRRRAPHPAGLLLRIAGRPGASLASLARELGPLLGPGPAVPALEIEPHSEQQMLDFLAAPHEMLERRLLDPGAPPPP